MCGLVANVAHLGGGLPYAQIQEIRDAVDRFKIKKGGGCTFAFADSLSSSKMSVFSTSSSANSLYYVASAFEHIFMQPSGRKFNIDFSLVADDFLELGDVELVGLRFQSPFLREAFDRLGILPQFITTSDEKFKNFPNLFTEKKLTDAHRESLQSIGLSLIEQLIADISHSRRLSSNMVVMSISRINANLNTKKIFLKKHITCWIIRSDN